MVDIGLQVIPEYYRFNSMLDVETFIGDHSEFKTLFS